MKDSKVLKGILILAGLMLLKAGGGYLFNPVGFTARNGIDIGTDLSLFNEFRGTGGLLFGSGIVIILGVIHSRMAFTSTVVAIAIFLSYGLARMLSVGLDGMPAEGLLKASIVEIVVGLVAVFALYKYRDTDPETT